MTMGDSEIKNLLVRRMRRYILMKRESKKLIRQ